LVSNRFYTPIAFDTPLRGMPLKFHHKLRLLLLKALVMEHDVFLAQCILVKDTTVHLSNY